MADLDAPAEDISSEDGDPFEERFRLLREEVQALRSFGLELQEELRLMDEESEEEEAPLMFSEEPRKHVWLQSPAACPPEISLPDPEAEFRAMHQTDREDERCDAPCDPDPLPPAQPPVVFFPDIEPTLPWRQSSVQQPTISDDSDDGRLQEPDECRLEGEGMEYRLTESPSPLSPVVCFQEVSPTLNWIQTSREERSTIQEGRLRGNEELYLSGGMFQPSERGASWRGGTSAFS
ncbi:uncharacterized protein LOC134264053 [Saccostrea cucullata]|uniref:uncharacterized protein LOC134264053 n=1 Tax=Saccostrea cuccullata TaxID=36930 RepID=UPI002ED64962